MTDRFIAFQNALAQRDITLSQLALIGIVLVLAYVLVDRLPERVRPWIKCAYLVGGAGLYGVTIFVSVGAAMGR